MNVFVARQPIFDRRQKVIGYELLHRSGDLNAYSCSDGDQATSEVIINSFLIIGMDTLTRGEKAFINFSMKLLENESVFLLPKDLIVVEILESVLPDEKTVSVCKKLKERGYSIALDDFVYSEEYEPLLQLADIIKVCFLKTDPLERGALLSRIKNKKVKFLAEKVETREDFEQALELGYSLFQGYFFSKPIIIAGRDFPSFNPTYMRLLQEIYRPDLNIDQLEKFIKQDVALSYKLLKYVNSIQFGFLAEIRSIRQGLAILGQKGLVKWASLLALRNMGSDKPAELLISSVCRANFCEFIAPKVQLQERSSDFFLMGLFSHIDAFLDRPMVSILGELPMAKDVKGALLGENNIFGSVHELIIDYERGDWESFAGKALKLNLKEESVAHLYLESLKATNNLFVEY